MKITRSAILRIVAVLAVIGVFAAFAFLLSACNDGSDGSDNGEKPCFVYSQSEHIGWEQSLANFADSAFSEYNSNGEPAFIIPGLNSGENFILQGVAYSEALNKALLCGYINPDADSVNSVIFVIDMNKTAAASNGRIYNGVLEKELFLINVDGSAFKGHVGGIAVTDKNVWISNGKKLHRVSLETVINAKHSQTLAFEDAFSVPVLSSYCSYSDGILWVGEFEYAKDEYVTDAAHHNKDNSSLTAWTAGYVIDESGKEGFDSNTGFKSAAMGDTLIPDYILWHGEKVQGMSEAGNKIVLSTSYGRKNNSALYIYNNPVRSGAQADCTVVVAGREIPCYLFLGESKKVAAPPMTEDLSVMRVGDGYKLLVASESGAYYYHGYNPFSRSLYATDMVWLYSVEQ